jgi:Flp pilus assembly protein TadG
MTNPLRKVRDLLLLFRRAETGNVVLVFAIALIPIVAMMGAAIDYSRANSVKADMQAALDATALAMVKNSPLGSMTQAQMNTSPTNTFTALFNRPYAQNVGVTPTYTSGSPSTLVVAGSATVPTTFMQVVGIKQVAVATSATVSFTGAKTLSLNIVFDSSGSMIVGATAADVTAITNWVTANWNAVEPLDPAPAYKTNDTPPCAFACHDVGNATAGADMVQGLTNAHLAGATTRFDVMIAAAQQLLSHIQSEISGSAVLSQNTYLYNVMSFDTSLHTWGTKNMTNAQASAAINTVTPGLDTYMSTAISSLITQIGTQGTGASSSSPLKFLILITDGLQSDRNGNWNCSYSGHDAAWNFGNMVCFGSKPYPATIDTTQCTTIKNNGIVLAVLETPYVPLTGQDPGVQKPLTDNGYPYENSVRHVIYPNGPNTSSTLSAALQTCASPGYYYQATSSTDIATGFLSLTDQFLATAPYLSK